MKVGLLTYLTVLQLSFQNENTLSKNFRNTP